ncbi:uncharacterized protein B0H18DRAFT_953145 [Fomitopsis serialis]|uniref:uncharacterized protein n=1 Tax=Fomitopsis serialis TaxID=139415 RepID=UPI0020087FA5|nr:uncharacterized protein B0H18DRAFT_953145 [Neoantrodia serialis]KAH9930193.1 hypothetical protein B0H18DRAFT_953145 [Neoantrodia serialis]
MTLLYSPTERTINKIIRLVVETGTLTAGVAIVTLILCTRLPGTQYYETTLYVLTKLYANTFLANLVSRAFLEPPTPAGFGTRLETREVEDRLDSSIHLPAPGTATS